MDQNQRPLAVRAADFLATGFYSGRFPVAPGTAGSCTACAMALLVYYYSGPLSPAAVLAAAAVVTAAAILSTNIVHDKGLYGLGNKDPKQVVADEFAGFSVALIGHFEQLWLFIAALIAFRVFDIAKPPPVSTLEKLPRGYGIVMDDVMAGVYANAAVWLLRAIS